MSEQMPAGFRAWAMADDPPTKSHSTWVITRAEARAIVERAEQAEAVVRAAAKHCEECCRTDIDWKQQMRSHDALSRALARYRREGHGEPRKVWRPLRMDEYPPPGPTKLGGKITDRVRPILVYAPPLARREARDE